MHPRYWKDGVSSWVGRHPLGSVLLAGLLLRLIRIQGRELQYDDTFSIILSERSFPEIVSGTAADTMPPLYYFLLHIWMQAGREVWFIRLLSVILGLGVIALFFWTVEHWFGRSAASWAALLAAVSPLQIYHAQDIRMYVLMLFCQMGYVYFFTRLWTQQKEFQVSEASRFWNWAGLLGFGLGAMYSHNLAVFALVVPNLFLLAKRRLSLLIRLMAAQLVIGLGALPWLLMLPGQLEKIQRAFWTPRPGPVEVIQALILFTATLPLPPVLLMIAAVLSFQILIMLVIELARGGRHEPGTKFFGILLLAPPVLLFALSYLMRPVFVTRGFLLSSLAYFGLAGFVISAGWRRGSGKLLAGAFLVAAAISLPYYYSYELFPRSPFRQATAYLQENAQSHSVVVHENKLSYFPSHFYAPGFQQVFLADQSGSFNDTLAPASQEAMQLFPQADLETAVGSNSSVFYVTFTQVFAEYQQAGLQQPPNIDWLNAHYALVEHRVFNDLEIFHYER